MSATMKYSFRASRVGAGAPKRLQAGSSPQAAPSERVLRVARLMALAHKFQRMLDSGEVKSMAELARLGRVSRARITQIMDLVLLAPDIQDELLDLPPVEHGRDPMTLRALRDVCRTAVRTVQRRTWAGHKRSMNLSSETASRSCARG